jgi:hypothetical protein
MKPIGFRTNTGVVGDTFSSGGGELFLQPILDEVEKPLRHSLILKNNFNIKKTGFRPVARLLLYVKC